LLVSFVTFNFGVLVVFNILTLEFLAERIGLLFNPKEVAIEFKELDLVLIFKADEVGRLCVGVGKRDDDKVLLIVFNGFDVGIAVCEFNDEEVVVVNGFGAMACIFALRDVKLVVLF